MKLSEIRQILADRDIQLTKSLGQNFLHDANQLRRIIELAELRAGDKVLEIGPGLGPLTGLLLDAGAEVLAIEKDARLLPVQQVLATQFVNTGNAHHAYHYGGKGIVIEEPSAGLVILFHPSGRSASATTIQIHSSEGRTQQLTVSITGRISLL